MSDGAETYRQTVHDRRFVGGEEVVSPRRDDGLQTVDGGLRHLRTRRRGRDATPLATLDREDELVNDPRHVHVVDKLLAHRHEQVADTLVMKHGASKRYGNARRDLVDALGEDHDGDGFKFAVELLRHGNDEFPGAYDQLGSVVLNLGAFKPHSNHLQELSNCNADR